MKKTSEQWLAQVPENWELRIVDADGWDRKNYDYSFNQELITRDEFMRRLRISALQCNAKHFGVWE